MGMGKRPSIWRKISCWRAEMATEPSIRLATGRESKCGMKPYRVDSVMRVVF